MNERRHQIVLLQEKKEMDYMDMIKAKKVINLNSDIKVFIKVESNFAKV
ncbi:hypothetical protein KPL47_09775 [Clostridium estertheticum]|nr:hypothetical protein [Clostridium estertheticum]MBU3176661.1 hypothetical protein [Clostridium estertheticum]